MHRVKSLWELETRRVWIETVYAVKITLVTNFVVELKGVPTSTRRFSNGGNVVWISSESPYMLADLAAVTIFSDDS